MLQLAYSVCFASCTACFASSEVPKRPGHLMVFLIAKKLYLKSFNLVCQIHAFSPFDIMLSSDNPEKVSLF